LRLVIIFDQRRVGIEVAGTGVAQVIAASIGANAIVYRA
jgi:hypothetical protein